MTFKFILLDIEGTISDIHFVKNVLFPYSEKHMRSYIEANFKNSVVQEVIQGTQQSSTEAAISQLLTWIKNDIKHPALKTIQGLIWKQGFEAGEFKSSFYPDVLPRLIQWREHGLRIGIYSSGSKQAQDLFFKHNTAGDVRDLFEVQFDLSLGSKTMADSYQKIANQVGLIQNQILFLSDSALELDAAKSAGLETFEICREGMTPSGRHAHTSTLESIDGLFVQK